MIYRGGRKASAAELEIARRHHPAWEGCSEFVRGLMARNVSVLAGGADAVGERCAVVIGWTPGDGMGGGGTGHTYRVARAMGIPVIELARGGVFDEISRPSDVDGAGDADHVGQPGGATMDGRNVVRMSGRWRRNAWLAVGMGLAGVALLSQWGAIGDALEGTRWRGFVTWGIGSVLFLATTMLWQVARARHRAFGELRLLTSWLYLKCAAMAQALLVVGMIWAFGRFGPMDQGPALLAVIEQVKAVTNGVLGVAGAVWLIWFVLWLVALPFTSRRRARAAEA